MLRRSRPTPTLLPYSSREKLARRRHSHVLLLLMILSAGALLYFTWVGATFSRVTSDTTTSDASTQKTGPNSAGQRQRKPSDTFDATVKKRGHGHAQQRHQRKAPANALLNKFAAQSGHSMHKHARHARNAPTGTNYMHQDDAHNGNNPAAVGQLLHTVKQRQKGFPVDQPAFTTRQLHERLPHALDAHQQMSLHVPYVRREDNVFAEKEDAQQPPPAPLEGMHALTLQDIQGSPVPLSSFARRVLLVVNVASACGYTDSNYQGLQQLYQKYHDRGFEVLAFPCNQFGGQEPGTNEEIKAFASQRYQATFPLFSKVDVNGANASPLFTLLKADLAARHADGSGGGDIAWNFEKFLIDRSGHVVQRYSSEFDRQQLEADIEAVLGAGGNDG